MDFEFSPEVQAMQRTLRRFVDDHVVPANNEWHRLAEAGTYPLAVIEPLKARARAAGLGRLFVLTTRTAHWFLKRGFAPVDVDRLPVERQQLYNWQRKSQILMKSL